LAEEIREYLKKFYGILKNIDKRGFTFITGVTKFAKTSIFSTLNDLDDLTFNEDYASICGFTLKEFDELFPEYMEKMLESLKSSTFLSLESNASDLRELILKFYDGYSWDGKTRILNPWAILEAFKKQEFGDYWCQSGGRPAFIDSLVKSGMSFYNELKQRDPQGQSFNTIDLGSRLKPIPLMFQAGYLSISSVDKASGTSVYCLDYPNLEVKISIIPLLLSMDPVRTPLIAVNRCKEMVNALNDLDFVTFQKSFERYLACYPYSIHDRHEAYYHALFLSAMITAGVESQCEGSVGDGKYDINYKSLSGMRFIIEVKYHSLKNEANSDLLEEQKVKKMNELAIKAIKQIEDTNYTLPYRGTGGDIYKVALVVGGRSRVFVQFKKEEDN
jgi:hypothetical protein